MNYGRKAVNKRRQALTSSTSMLGNKAHVSLIRVILLLIITLAVTLSCAGIGALQGILANSPNVDKVDIMPLGYATFLYDVEGNQLRKLAAPDANRLPVSIDQIPEDLQHAVVAIEDERFYEHNGIDVKGILRAGAKALADGHLSEGASTITQQLLKNNVFTNWTNESSLIESITRKFQEQYLAVQIEKKIADKSVILENYLNTINLGAGSYGVQAAAHQYFNKDVWDLNLSECATLAGITQNPTRFNPIVNPEENAQRRKMVLEHMLSQGYITKKQYNKALNDDVYTRIQKAQEVNQVQSSKVYSYFEDELTSQVISDLMRIKGYTRTQAQNMLYSGGLSIYTTQDPDIQAILDEEYENPSNYPSQVQYELDYALTIQDSEGDQINYSKEMMQLYFQNENPDFDLLFDSEEEGKSFVEQYKSMILQDGGEVIAERINFAPQPQSSMSVIDQHTGYVKAIVGGRGEKTASLTLNRAADTTRQPGSTFKLVSTYAPALNEKGMSLATLFDDAPFTYPNGAPVNNYDHTFSGPTTIRKAIINSLNTVAVRCLEAVTPELGLKYLDDFGFTTLAHGGEEDTDMYGNVYSDVNLATALGGITHGVTNVELCASYAAIANGGTYIKPIYYTKILDHNGNILIENNSVGRTVIRDTTAWLLTSAMTDVVRKGTGTACQLDNMIVAGKTGTTEQYNDLWFVGYTPYYTCAVWAGYDNNATLPEYARHFQQALWKKVMTRIHKSLPYRDFTMPSSIQTASICTVTGLLASDSCESYTEFFEPGTQPKEYCSGHYTYYEEEEDNLESYYTTSEEHPTPSHDTETDVEEEAWYQNSSDHEEAVDDTMTIPENMENAFDESPSDMWY